MRARQKSQSPRDTLVQPFEVAKNRKRDQEKRLRVWGLSYIHLRGQQNPRLLLRNFWAKVFCASRNNKLCLGPQGVEKTNRAYHSSDASQRPRDLVLDRSKAL